MFPLLVVSCLCGKLKRVLYERVGSVVFQKFRISVVRISIPRVFFQGVGSSHSSRHNGKPNGCRDRPQWEMMGDARVRFASDVNYHANVTEPICTSHRGALRDVLKNLEGRGARILPLQYKGFVSRALIPLRGDTPC